MCFDTTLALTSFIVSAFFVLKNLFRKKFNVIYQQKGENAKVVLLTDLIYEGISKELPYKRVFDLLSQELGIRMKGFFKKTHDELYLKKDPKEVLIKVKKDKWRYKKRHWVKNATEGYEYYLATGEKKRSIYRHMIDDYLTIKQLFDMNTLSWFKSTFNEETPERVIQKKINELYEWKDSEDAFLVDYLYLHALTPKLKERAFMDDIAVLIGLWYVRNEDCLQHIRIENNQMVVDDRYIQQKKMKEDVVVTQAPYEAVNNPFWGLSDRGKNKLKKQPVVSIENRQFLEVEPSNSFELVDGVQLFIDLQANEANKNSVKLLDMKDWKIFMEICRHRDVNFQVTRSIRISLPHLLKFAYGSTPNRWAYNDLVSRLIRMRAISLATKTEEGTRFSSLFSDVVFQTDHRGVRYAIIYISDKLYTNIIEEEFINVYGQEVLELEDPFINHLVFIVQKFRMRHYREENEDIQFSMDWNDFSASMFMNRATKKEILEKIQEGLSIIQEKKFIINTFQRIGNRFIIMCKPLSKYELIDMRKSKIFLKENQKFINPTTLIDMTDFD